MDAYDKGQTTWAHIWVVPAVLLAALLTVAGCGDDGGSAAAPTSTVTATSSPTPTRTLSPAPTLPATATPSVTSTATPAVTATPLSIAFNPPVDNELVLAGDVAFGLNFPFASEGSITLDGVTVPAADIVANPPADIQGTLHGVSPGPHVLAASFIHDGQSLQAERHFEAVALDRPDECEVLNNADCLLPYPSSRFLEPAQTATGVRVHFPDSGMPQQQNRPLPAAPYLANDGFSPTVQILMHFPGGVDPVASDASRLLPDTRTYNLRSLDADSPTVLLDADTGERVLHFIENDARATDTARQVVFFRPARSLTPAHHYIVAVRHLVHPDGTPVTAEPAFAALRDGRPTNIAAIESRRAAFASLFATLATAGVGRQDLVLAFDFTVGSDAGLTSQMLAMRDQAFSWLAGEAAAGTPTFAIDNVIEHDCSTAGTREWREIQGTYQVPLFLTADPIAAPAVPATLRLDDNGVPLAEGFTHPPFTIAIPCTALSNGGTPKAPLVLGHGLFGNGRGFVEQLASAPALGGFDYIIGATDWSGLSAPDVAGDDLTRTFIGHVILNLVNLPALPDRLRQGQLNTLLLAKMMKLGVFNAEPAFQTPAGVAVLQGPEHDEFYFGASLGGIMGLMFAALSPDVANVQVDVPAINFSILLQRATPFIQFEGALELTGISDPMEQAVLLSVIHELWVRGESAGYATHITSDPLPGTNAKHILMTAGFLDQQVSNVATDIAARTLGLPNLVGSFLPNLPQIPDEPGPLPSALVYYDTGSFDLGNPADAPFIPPLANLPAQPNRCDPHGLQATIPAALDQTLAFLQPGGQITSFCNGLCDAAEPLELPNGNAAPCNPVGP